MRKLSFSIFVYFSIILFCSLGTWQIYRLQWKLDLISEIKNGLNSEPVFYSSANIKNYQKVKFNGIFDFEKQIYLYSLNSSGVPGYDIITPIKIKSNEILRKLKILPIRFLSNITFIKDLSLDKQAKITKLKISELVEFNNRNFSISIVWNGNIALLTLFRKYLIKLNFFRLRCATC